MEVVIARANSLVTKVVIKILAQKRMISFLSKSYEPVYAELNWLFFKVSINKILLLSSIDRCRESSVWCNQVQRRNNKKWRVQVLARARFLHGGGQTVAMLLLNCN